MADGEGNTIWTIGHSTHPADEFVALLDANGIEAVVDVRRFPGSRRLPQFGSDALRDVLEHHGIAYRWIEALGGRRRASAAPSPSAWRHPAFAAYADYAESEEFAEGLFELTMIAFGIRTAIMCAEAVWWRCHRRIISDVLVSLGVPVEHILGAGKVEPHELAAPARIVHGQLSYAPPEP